LQNFIKFSSLNFAEYQEGSNFVKFFKTYSISHFQQCQVKYIHPIQFSCGNYNKNFYLYGNVLNLKSNLKDTSARFLPPGFFHQLTPYGPLIHNLIFFKFGLKSGEIFIFEICSLGPASQLNKKICELGDSLCMDPLVLG
jgi:hypothetical protein